MVEAAEAEVDPLLEGVEIEYFATPVEMPGIVINPPPPPPPPEPEKEEKEDKEEGSSKSDKEESGSPGKGNDKDD